jgi:hypothetical protein
MGHQKQTLQGNRVSAPGEMIHIPCFINKYVSTLLVLKLQGVRIFVSF